MGRLTREPEIRQSADGRVTIAKYSLAVDRRFKREGEPTADFFNCTSFGKTAEFIQNYTHKGTKLVVSGRLQNDSYTNNEGARVTRTEIIVDEAEFAESKAFATQNEPVANAQTDAQADAMEREEFMSIPDGLEDELPFR